MNKNLIAKAAYLLGLKAPRQSDQWLSWLWRASASKSLLAPRRPGREIIPFQEYKNETAVCILYEEDNVAVTKLAESKVSHQEDCWYSRTHTIGLYKLVWLGMPRYYVLTMETGADCGTANGETDWFEIEPTGEGVLFGNYEDAAYHFLKEDNDLRQRCDKMNWPVPVEPSLPAAA